MASLNKVMLIGNLTKDPELRYTPSGTAVVNLRMAVNRKFRDKNQELKEEACFVTVVVWDKQAETCNQYLHKGSPLFIEGRLQSRSWDAADGTKRSVIEVRAERFQFLGQAPAKQGASLPQAYPAESPQVYPAESPQDTPAPQEETTEAAWLTEESEEKINEG